MPEFDPGSVHRATAIFSNPKSSGFDYEASLCMGAEWTEMATASFHLAAGQSKSIQFSATMPSAVGTYPVYFKVYSGGVLIGTFAATEDVVIKPVAAVVTIALKNYPTIWPGVLWLFLLMDRTDDGKGLIEYGAGDFNARLTFNIPPDWEFPLRFECDIYEEYTGELIYAAQSIVPWIGFYVPEYIPSYGNYYFNVATSKFEKI